MGTRATYRAHVQDEEGRPIAGAEVYVYQQHTTTPITETIFQEDSDHATLSAATLTNPLTTASDGLYRLFLADAKRVDLKIVKDGYDDFFKYGVDVSKNTASSIQVQDEGVSLTSRDTWDFTGAGVTASDVGGKTVIDVPAAAATPLADAAPPAVADAGAVGASTDAAREDHAHAAHTQMARKNQDNAFTVAQSIGVDGPAELTLRRTTNPGVTGSNAKLAIFNRDAAGNDTEMLKLVAQIEDVTDASEDAYWRFFVMRAGTLTEVIRITQEGRINLGASSSSPEIIQGAGTPEGSVTARVGSVYHRNDGAGGTTLYVKESGTGNTGWVAFAIPDVKRAAKTADEAVANTNVLQDDDHLSTALATGTTYLIDAAIIAETSSSTPDIKLTLAYTGTSSFAEWGYSASQATDTDGAVAFGTTRAIQLLGAGPEIIRLNALITTTSAATLKFQWTQDTGSAGATTVHAGSWMRAEKV